PVPMRFVDHLPDVLVGLLVVERLAAIALLEEVDQAEIEIDLRKMEERIDRHVILVPEADPVGPIGALSLVRAKLRQAVVGARDEIEVIHLEEVPALLVHDETPDD